MFGTTRLCLLFLTLAILLGAAPPAYANCAAGNCPTQPGQQPTQFRFPEGWGQEDRFPTENGSFGHQLLWSYLQVTNPADTGRQTYHIALAPGLDIDMPTVFKKEHNGTRWYTDGEKLPRWRQMQWEVFQRDNVHAPLFIVRGTPLQYTVTIYDNGDQQGHVGNLPTGFYVIPAVENRLPQLDPGTNPSTDGRPEFYQITGGDLPLGDHSMHVYGYAYFTLWGEASQWWFLVKPGWILRIPAGYAGWKQHLVSAPQTLQRGTMIISGPDSLPAQFYNAGWRVQQFPVQ